MPDDKPAVDSDNPQTPLEQTANPAELDALREAAKQVAIDRSVLRRPRSSGLDDTTLTDGEFNTEPESDADLNPGSDPDNPQTPLEPTLDPHELDAVKEAAASVANRTPIARPRPPSPLLLHEAIAVGASSPAAAQQPGCSVPQPPSLPASEPPFLSTQSRDPMWRLVLPTAFLLAVVMLLATILPLVLVHWKKTEASAAADKLYLERRAVLKAEAEAAAAELDQIDKKIDFDSRGFRLVVKKAAPSVVSIANLKEAKKEDAAHSRNVYHDPTNDRRYEEITVGSGLLFKPGYLITNYHVVKGAERLRITFNNSRVLGVEAAAVVSDPGTDIAVIKLPTNVSDELKEDMKQTAVFADSDKSVEVGDWALAIGSPKNLRQSVTLGIISAKGRLINELDLVELMQTDAAINHGSSGGPLFDQRGRVVGVIVALANEKGANLGIGFAIPSNTASKIANALIEHGEVSRGYLGIGMEQFTGPQAKLLGVPGAVLVTKVWPQEAGDKAGLRPKDIILKINNEPLHAHQSVRHLRQLIADLEPGTQANLEIYRDNARQNLVATIGKRPLLPPTP